MALNNVYLLNGFRPVGADNRLITKFYSQKAKALFVYLLLEGSDRGQSRSHLAGLLWPDSSETRARRNLSQTLTALRKDIKDQRGEASLFLTSTRDISLNPNAKIDVDVWAFQTHLAAVQKTPQTETTLFESLTAAAELYSGPLLDQFGDSDSDLFEQWLLTYRERLHQQAIETFSQLAEGYTAQGKLTDALRHTDRLIQLAPWQESAHRQRMILLARQGKRAQALAQYETLSDVLKKELGVFPAPETDELYDQIDEGKIGPDISPGNQPTDRAKPAETESQMPPVPFQAPPGSPHFVGRDREITLISDFLGDDTANATPIALVGMGGVGKSTLAAHITHAFQDRFKDGVLWGNPVISNPLDILDLWAQAFGHDFSNLPDIGSKAAAVRGLLAGKEALVVLDNVDEAADVRSLLPSGSKCKVLLTTRSLEVAAALNARHVRMREFTAKSSETLMIRILGESRINGPPKQLRDAQQMCQQLHHLPLAIEIVAQKLRSRPGMPLAAMAQRLESTQQRLGLKISNQAVRSSFEVSWEELPAQAKVIFAAMGIFEGRSFTAEALAAITQLDFYDVEDELYSLVALSLVNQVDGNRYQQHPLLADFAADKLSLDSQILSLTQSNMVDYYLNFALGVGNEYERLSSDWEQLSAVARIAHTAGKWEALIQLSQFLTPAWKSRGRYSQARRVYQLAYEAAQRLNDINNGALILMNWGEAALEQNDYDVAEKRLNESLNGHLHLEEGVGIAKAQYLLARLHIDQNHFETAKKLLGESEDILRSMSLESQLGDIIFQQGVIAFSDGLDLDTADKLFDEAYFHYESIDDIVGKIEVLRLRAHIAERRGEYFRAEEAIQQAKVLSEEIQDRGQIASNLFTLMSVYIGQKKYDLAQKAGEESLDLFKLTGSKRMEGLVLRQLMLVYRDMQDYETALDLGFQSLNIFADLNIKLSQAFALNSLGSVYERSNEQTKAKEMWQTAYQLATELDHQSLLKELSKSLNQLS